MERSNELLVSFLQDLLYLHGFRFIGLLRSLFVNNNDDSATMSVSGFRRSDTVLEPAKWKFPSDKEVVTQRSNELLVSFLQGLLYLNGFCFIGLS